MAANMKAAFTLTLEDKLTAGLKKIGSGFEDLKRAAKDLNLGQLGERGADMLRAVTDEARTLTSSLRTVEAVAERSWTALKRMASVTFKPVGRAVTSVGRGVVKIGRGMAGEGGLASAAQAVGGYEAVVAPSRAYADYESGARQSAINKGLSGPDAAAESKRLMGVFNRDALATGQSSESISEAYRDLIATGIDPKLVETILPFHSRAATAYNITPESLGHAVGSLIRNFQIDENGMPGTLASMALASKSGLFKVQDFSDYLPGIGGNYSQLGMTGRGAADEAFASLEIVNRNAKDPAQAEANYNDFLGGLTAPHSVRAFALDSRGMSSSLKAHFKKYHVHGIDLPKTLEDARKVGIDPQTAVLAELHKVTDNLPPDVKAEVLKTMLGNQQAGSAAQALLEYGGDYDALRKKLAGADPAMLDRDFNTAHAAPKVGLDTAGEAGKQLERRAGEGFEPIIEHIGQLEQTLLKGINDLDTAFPGLGNAVIGVTGGLLALSTALATIGFVAPAAASGASMIGAGVATVAGVTGAPLVGVAAVGAAAAVGWSAAGQVIPWVDPNTGVPYDPRTGMPMWDSRPPVDLTPKSPQTQSSVHVIVSAAPGTDATVTRASPGVTVTGPNPGQTTNRP